MPLTVDSRLGRYDVTALIGECGVGEFELTIGLIVQDEDEDDDLDDDEDDEDDGGKDEDKENDDDDDFYPPGWSD